ARLPDLKAVAYGYEIIIDKPVHDVWPHLHDYLLWNPEHFGSKVETLAGRKGEKGQIVVERKPSGEGFAPPWFIETICAIPNERLVWAMYFPEGQASGTGFVEFTLNPIGGKTLLIARGYGAYPSTFVGAIDKATLERSCNERVAAIIPKLKGYVESR